MYVVPFGDVAFDLQWELSNIKGFEEEEEESRIWRIPAEFLNTGGHMLAEHRYAKGLIRRRIT